jgi:hypothetical protein
VPRRAIIILFYQVPNGVIQWIFKCQMGRLLLFQWILSAKWGDYYYFNGFQVPNGAIIIISMDFKCQMGRLLLYAKWGDSLLYAKWGD